MKRTLTFIIGIERRDEIVVVVHLRAARVLRRLRREVADFGSFVLLRKFLKISNKRSVARVAERLDGNSTNRHVFRVRHDFDGRDNFYIWL